MQRPITVLIVTALCLSVWKPVLALPPLSQQDNVRETVLRYLFKKYRHVPDVQVYFISGGYVKPGIGGRERDLSDALMGRFGANVPAVRRVSRKIVSGYGFRDKVTGASGIVFLINDILRMDKNSATVDAEVFTGAVMQATEAKYDLNYDGLRWKVIKEYDATST